MGHILKPVTTEADRQAMHAIRRATLFVKGRHGDEIVYNENHPDDRNPSCQPFLLLLDGTPIGVVRLDRHGDRESVVRLVGIDPPRQGQGHGRVMSDLVDDKARVWGIVRLLVNAHISAEGFYLRTGWHREAWDPTELTGVAANCVQMTKQL